MKRAQPSDAGIPNQESAGVDIVDFSDSGESRGVVHIPKVVKSESEWRKQLSPSAFNITRADLLWTHSIAN